MPVTKSVAKKLTAYCQRMTKLYEAQAKNTGNMQRICSRTLAKLQKTEKTYNR